MFLCIVFWTHYLGIDLRFHHARISRRFYIRNIRLNGLSTRQAEFRGEAGSLGPWEYGSTECAYMKIFQPARTVFVLYCELQSLVARV